MAFLPEPSKPNVRAATTALANKLQAFQNVFCWTVFRTITTPQFIFYNIELNDSLKNFKGNKNYAAFINFEGLIKVQI